MKVNKFFLILVISGMVGSLSAQTIKIGVVNVQQLLEQVPQAQSATIALQNEFAGEQRELIALQSELQQLTERYERDGPVMAEGERIVLERELLQVQRDFERESTTFSEDLNIRRNDELNLLQRIIFEQIQLYAETESYDLIVADALYYSAATDITDQLLDAMQELFTAD